MLFLFVFLLAGLSTAETIKEEGAGLRSGCSSRADVIRQLPAGTELQVRYSLAGQSVPCYKVTATVEGRPVDGYLSQDAFENLDAFENARRQGGRIGVSEVMGAVQSSASLPWTSGATSTSGALPEDAALSIQTQAPEAAQRASALMEAGQPGRALTLLESEFGSVRDPGLLALAGAAAWRADDLAKALKYWNESLSIRPDASLQRLYERVRQESAADQSDQRLYGMRVLLRYEDTSISAGTAREMMQVVDQEFTRISQVLGCNNRERIVAVAQSREAYMGSTNAAEWSGGQFSGGRIRIPVLDQGGLDPQTRKTLAHETAHACLAMIDSGQLPGWPAWVHEGVAQYVSGESLPPQVRATIGELARAGQLPSLNNVARSFSAMDTASAQVAYALALRAIEVYVNDFGSTGLRNLLNNPGRLTQIAADLDRRLGQ